ncbi:MAG: SHOCT domain-containing protein [Gammaproteobacteria bacterium]
MFHHDGFMGGTFGGMSGGLGWLLLLAVLVVAFVFISKTRFGRPDDRTRTPANEAPHEVLQRRLASGEITPAEYEERKAILDRDRGRSS